MNNARGTFNGCGTNTAALAVGGKNVPSSGDKTELWNGTNWTAVNDLSGASRYGSGVAGITTSALIFGGFSGASNLTESWNGTNWTAVTAMNQGRAMPAGAGTSNNSALATAGGSPSASTEEWDAGPTTITFSVS